MPRAVPFHTMMYGLRFAALYDLFTSPTIKLNPIKTIAPLHQSHLAKHFYRRGSLYR